MKYSRWLEKNTHSLNGKNVVITGSTGGLGKEICLYLLYLGADLILIDRNPQKSSELDAFLKLQYPKAKIKHLIADMEDFSSVKSVSETLKSLEVDVLILNAGAYSIPRRTTDTGFDNVFQINFVSHYYITKELLPLLSMRKGRVIAVGSIAHNYSKTDPLSIDFKDRNKSSLVYGNSKRYLMFSLFELFKEHNQVSLSITHPGITFTNITSHYPKFIFALIKYPMKLIFMKPKKAALSIIKGLFNETKYHTWIGPGRFDIWGNPEIKALKTCTEAESKQIFNNAEYIYNNLKKNDC